MPTTRKLLAWVLISFCLAGLLSACSSTRLGYQNLPWLVSWKSRDYVPLTREQRAWLGRLQSEQQERIADWSARLSGQNAVWLDNRRYWLDAFTAALDARDKPDFAAQIERLLTDRESYWTDSFRERTEINSQLAAHMLSDVMALNSTSQNARLRQRLDRLQADIERIDCSNNI